MSDWFSTGQAAVDKALAKGGFASSSSRFWLKSGNESVIAFCDGDNSDKEPIGNCKEHDFKIHGSNWPGFTTCVGMNPPEPFKPCPLCKAGLKPYEAWPFTIIQVSTNAKDKDGKDIPPNQKKLLMAKKESMQRILRHITQRKGLVGTIWNAFRSGSSAVNIGDDWQFAEKVDGGRDGLAKKLGVPLELVQPFVYRDILKPKTSDELASEGVDYSGSKESQDAFRAKFKDKSRGAAPAAGAAPRGDATVPYKE
jgi:hypothetical protein